MGTFAIGSAVTFKYKFGVSFDVLLGTGTELYIAPWTRISPYCVGVACGWYLHSYRKKFIISNVRTTLTLPMQNLLFTIFTSLKPFVHRDGEDFLSSFRRFCWWLRCTVRCIVTWEWIWLRLASFLADRWSESQSAGSLSWTRVDIAVSWATISYFNNQLYVIFPPGLVSRIFSSRLFVRINKLTYAIYLLNPIIISVVFGKFENGGTVDPMLYFIIMIGITIITYIFAIVFTLLFEIPFYKLSNEILKGAQPVSKKIN